MEFFPMTVGVKDARPQFGLINLLKAAAAQLIVLHHLALYGPMSDYARPIMPALLDWLEDWGRLAVQVFLVMGGFLAAKSLSPKGFAGLSTPLQTIWKRYAKLVPPFLVAMMLAVAASALARTWMNHDSISPPASLDQMLAHAFLLHGVLGYESLSAGAWYVAIDFQLYAMFAAMLWLLGRLAGSETRPWLMPVAIALCASASVLYFNLDGDWDVWAPYFFGSYGLGIVAWWASERTRPTHNVLLLLAMILLPTLLALVIEFRERIALAVAVAVVLYLFGRARLPLQSSRVFKSINGLGRISYSIFLVHFPVCLVVNAAFVRFFPTDPYWQGAGVLVAWGASLGAGALFFHLVEAPLGRLWQPAVRQPQRYRNFAALPTQM
ncbi:acyltransferase [Massilia sp. CF038]|uniref:acyltransferase family protein n=1 Tax=Massilia sp. CF038 TaxID=1881045 RepID=UPI0027D8CCF5|nr:acyltransferase [Massilia sp. CF038]